VSDDTLGHRAAGFSGLSARLRRLDSNMLVLLLLSAVLVFLVLNPILRLLVSSLQQTDSCPA
jgi:iron(III) transport system permease protein